MIVAHVQQSGSQVIVKPLAYSAAFRDFMRAVPGPVWNPDAKHYSVPEELYPVIREQTERAGLARYEGDSKPIYPTRALPQVPPEFRNYQALGVDHMRFIVRTGAALLADEPGLGKSAQALIALKPCKRTLIVCPAVVVGHWADQIKRWLGGDCLKLSKKNLAAWQSGFAVVSYDTMRGLAKNVPPAQGIILDEIHYLSNARSGRSKALSNYVELSRRAGCDQVFGLSGTPMLVRPKDLHHPLNVLWPGRFGTWWGFTRRYCDGRYEDIPGVGAVWVCDGASNLEELQARLSQLMVRRQRHECLELPDRIRQTIKVPLPAKLLKQFQAAARQIVGEGEELRQALQAIEPHKLEAAVQLAEDLIANGDRPLILVTRRASAEWLGDKLGCPWVTGETLAHKRRDALLGNGSGPAVATIYSVTTGIDLTAFNALIIVGLDWVPSTLLQAEARIHRIGQHHPVNIYYLIGEHTIDESIKAKVIERLGVFDQMMGGSMDERALAMALGDRAEDLIASIIANIGNLAA